MNQPNRSIAIFLLVALAFAVTMMGTTLPTPLYPLYQDAFGFSSFMVTAIYAVYAAGVIAALLLTGRWSDQIGRRPMLLVGMIFSAASAGVFIWGSNAGLSMLFLGRVLSGISAGIFTGTATITVVELAPSRWSKHATLLATAANMTGLGLGPLFAGLFVQYLPAPLVLCFVADIVLIALGMAAIAIAPETACKPETPRLTVQPLRIPAETLSVFVPAATASFAGFAVLGLFSGLTPLVLSEVLGISSSVLTGLLVFVLFIASTLGQCVEARLRDDRRFTTGCIILIIGALLVAFALFDTSLTWLIIGILASGFGQGISFRASIAAIAEASPVRRRGEVASAFFVVVYVAISIPVLGVGLAAAPVGLRNTGIIFSGAAAVLAAISVLLITRRQAQRT